ncbi:Cysteine desulfurase IscS [Streptomyces hirsutus]
MALATVMWANNEIGTILPVRELAETAAEFGVPLHSDAVQAFGQVPVDFASSGLAAMTVSGHKIGGPYGIGALVLGREYTPVPVLHGGGQERHVRSGTLDVPAVASFAVAGRLAAERREWFAREVGALRDDLIAAVHEAVPDAVLGGDPASGGRLPANAHFTFPAVRATPCCSCSTPRASSAPPVPPAPPVSPSPATSCWPPAPTRTWPAAPSASPRSHLHPGRRRGTGEGHRAGGGACAGGGADLTSRARRRPTRQVPFAGMTRIR